MENHDIQILNKFSLYKNKDEIPRPDVIENISLSPHNGIDFVFSSDIISLACGLGILLNKGTSENTCVGVVDDTEKIARLCLSLGYKNSIIVNGQNKYPYATLEGENYISEAWKNKVFTYTLTPDLVDLKEEEVIFPKSREENFHLIYNVFDGKIKNAPYGSIILNAGLSLYITKKSPTLIDGIALAKHATESGMAREVLLKCNLNI